MTAPFLSANRAPPSSILLSQGSAKRCARHVRRTKTVRVIRGKPSTSRSFCQIVAGKVRYRLQNENPAGFSMILSRREIPDGTRQQATATVLYHLYSLNIPRRGDVVTMPARGLARRWGEPCWQSSLRLFHHITCDRHHIPPSRPMR